MTIHRKTYTVRQGRQSLSTTTTTNDESGIQTIEYTIKNGKQKRTGKIERDLKTGKLLPPEELRDVPKSLKDLMIEQLAEMTKPTEGNR